MLKFSDALRDAMLTAVSGQEHAAFDREVLLIAQDAEALGDHAKAAKIRAEVSVATLRVYSGEPTVDITEPPNGECLAEEPVPAGWPIEVHLVCRRAGRALSFRIEQNGVTHYQGSLDMASDYVSTGDDLVIRIKETP